MIEALALAGVFATQIAATWIFYRLGYRDGAGAAERAHLSRQVKAIEALRPGVVMRPAQAQGPALIDELIEEVERADHSKRGSVLRLVPASTSRERMNAAFDAITRELDALDDPALKDKRSW